MPSSNSIDGDYQSDASRSIGVSRRRFLPVTIDDKRTYQKWKRGTFVIYGAVTIILVMLSIAIGPADQGSTGKSEMYFSLAPAVGKSR